MTWSIDRINGNALGSLKLRQPFQFLHPAVNVNAFDFGGARQAKTFATKRRRDAAVNHRTPEVGINQIFGRRQITHQAADEGIARAGRINHLVQRIRRTDEKSARPGQNRAVRTFFDDDVFRSQLVDFFQRGKNIILFRQLMRLAVVEHKTVNARQQFQ